MIPAEYKVSVVLSRRIPTDILIEHMAVGLRSLGETKVLSVRADLDTHETRERGRDKMNATTNVTTTFKEPVGEYAKPSEPRAHPFDGPEVFDDDVNERLPLTADFWNALAADFPHLTQFFSAKGRTLVSPPREEPPAEGDWGLEPGDRVGEDV